MDYALPHQKINEANENAGLSENDRLRLIAAAETEMTEARARIMEEVEHTTAAEVKVATDLHDTGQQIAVDADAVVKRAKAGGLTAAEIHEALEDLRSRRDKAARRVAKVHATAESEAVREADPYAAHVARINRFPTLNRLAKSSRRI